MTGRWTLLDVGPASRLRVDVVLSDPSKLEQHYLAKWDMFLPSDMTPGSKICAHYIVWGFVLTLFFAQGLQLILSCSGSMRCTISISTSLSFDFWEMTEFLVLFFGIACHCYVSLFDSSVWD